MKVNNSKTVSLLISELKSYLPKVFFSDTDRRQVKAGDSMKILGFQFGSGVDMSAQVQ